MSQVTVAAATSSTIRAQYTQLCQHLKKIYQLKSIEQLLEWDEMVMMPENGAGARSEQKQLLSGIVHDHMTHAQIDTLTRSLLSDAAAAAVTTADANSPPTEKNEKDEKLNTFERVNVLLARREFDKKIKIPKHLIEQQSKLNSDAYHAWVQARKESDWSKFSQFLTQWIQLRRTMSSLLLSSTSSDENENGKIGEKTAVDDELESSFSGDALYNVCLDEYEPGLSIERIDTVFNEIKSSLIPLIQRVEQMKKQMKNGQEKNQEKTVETIDDSFLSGPDGSFPLEQQQVLNRSIAEKIGFDFKSGRIDTSVHPFTISPSQVYDVRITTRYRTTEFLQGLAGTVHESGHAMYEQNLPREYHNLPVGSYLSMGVHESQSLFWERHVALSKAFFAQFWPLFQSTFPYLKSSKVDNGNTGESGQGAEREITAEQAYRAANTVEPIFIRVESDEVTYPLHIILRYEIERGLFNNEYTVEELPGVWNRKMEQYLGIVPSKDSEGILQDVHWSMGAFGYFPTYLLGAVMAAQIAAKLPNFETLLEKGDYQAIKHMLNEKIHSRGSVDMNADKLLEHATGEPLNPKYFIEYLTQKYTEIYGL